MLQKYECESKNVDSNALIYKEKLKMLLRCFCGFVIFFLFFYVPLYFQATVRKSSRIIVEGWGLNVNRSVANYVFPHNETAVILNSQLCAEPLLLLVIICSAIHNLLERNTIRETWGNYTHQSVKIVFLLGLSENSTLQEMVEEESNVHSDIIQENFIDSYNNLTLKSVMLLKLISTHCDNVEYILKSDDDMFVHVQNLLFLVQKYREQSIKNILVGELICDAKPIQDSNNKWYSPKYMYSGRFYPHYLSGTGYLMDKSTSVQLYKAALTTPFFHLEDVYITGLCAKKANIKPRHHPGFSYSTRPLDPCLYIKNSNVITSHRVSLDNMRLLWYGLHNQTYCSETTSSTATTLKGKHVPRKLSTVKKNYRCA